ncbi:MAG: efflux RND transporter periplasmic adaptor subunit, partial [Cyanobacteriota bacterium]
MMLSKNSRYIPLQAKQQDKMNFLHSWQCIVPPRATQIALVLTLLAPALGGCGGIFTSQVEAQPEQGRQDERPPSVEVAIAKTDSLGERLSYTGNTEPLQEVSLRSQTEGRLLKLNVDIGDRVQTGQILAQLDDILLQTALSEAEAELAARESEVIRARNQVRNAEVRAEQAKVELQQAQADATRYLSLAKDGAVSQQQAELSQTQADVKRQALESAQEQIRIEQEAVITAEQRVKAQQSAVAQVRERRSYAFLTSPIRGVVLERVTEPGNLIQPGGEVLKLGDFRQVKVVVPVSEIALGTIEVGQPVTVNLDAFPNQSFSGRVSRISPAANAATRQVPIEVTIPNSEG